MKNLLSTFLLFGFIVSCGDISGNIEEQYKSGSCGSTVVADYNSMVYDCKYMTYESDLQECKSKLEKFKSKYPGINCSVERGYGLDKEKGMITESEIVGYLSVFQEEETFSEENEIKSQSQTVACEASITEDYRNLSSICSESVTIADVQECMTLLSLFSTNYPGVVCDTEIDGYELTIEESVVKQTLEQLEELNEQYGL